MDNLPVEIHPVREPIQHADDSDPLTAAIHYHQLGMVEQEQLHFDAAISLFQKSLQIFEQAGDFYNAASDYHQLGIVAQRQRRLDDAIALFQKACQIFMEANDSYRASYPWMGLAEIATERGELEQASNYYRQAFDARSTAEDWPRASSVLNQWAQVLETQNQWAEAMHLYMQALSIDVEHNRHCFQLDIWDLGRMWGILGASEFETIWLKVAGQACPEKLYAKIRASKI
ncbi:MAG: tetratricopeptide repeat protein [Acaryochloridaceae cyanobacterium RU_4_10]|nr:tetratricopeptide repeat protein [Acaryochloridaceae cyanobacterium RU_4_10]